MKILFLCHRFPFPADGGGKIRALKIIEHLGQRPPTRSVINLARNPKQDPRGVVIGSAGHHLAICETASEVAEACLELMLTAERSRRLSVLGQRVVRQKYSWAMTLSDMESAIASF